MEKKYNIINIKTILNEGYTVQLLLDMFQNNFRDDYYTKKSFSPSHLIEKTDLIREFIDFVEQNDKYNKLIDILRKERPTKVANYPVYRSDKEFSEEDSNSLTKNIKPLYSETDGKNNYILVDGNNNIIIQDAKGVVIEFAEYNQKETVLSKLEDLEVNIRRLIYNLYANQIKFADKEFLAKIEKLSIGKNELDPELFFTNRKNEFFEIERHKYIYLYSPSGFGKTFLLNELQNKYKSKEYKTFLVHFKTVEGKTNKQYDYRKIENIKELDIWLSYLNASFKDVQEELNKLRFVKFLYIVDDFERIYNFEENVTKRMLSIIFDIISRFSANRNVSEFKVILSSKNNDIKFDNRLKQINFKPISLTPFGLDSIQDVVQNRLAAYDIAFTTQESVEYKKNISRFILNRTGGHPGAVIKTIDILINKYKRGDEIIYFDDENDDNYFGRILKVEFDTIIENTLPELLPDQYKDENNEKLLNLLKTVCVFRKFNAAVIHKLIHNNIIENYEDYSEALKDIDSTNLFEKGALYSDAVARYIIANYLLMKDIGKYNKVTESAIQFFKQGIGIGETNLTLKDFGDYTSELIYMTELLYHIVIKYKILKFDKNEYKTEILNLFTDAKESLLKKYATHILYGFKVDLIKKVNTDTDISTLFTENELNELTQTIIKNLHI